MRVLFAAVLLVLLAVPAALALPGDPQPAPLTPADGASVDANRGGIPVTFSCPGYRQDVYGDPADPITDFGTSEDYDVRFSPVPATDSTGVLGNEFSSTASITDNGGTCTTALDTEDSGTSPDAFGGRVYWQVTRPCVGCTPVQRENGPVRSFTVRGPKIASEVRLPKRVYAGYLTKIAVATKEEIGGARLELQRKVGKRWKTLEEADASKEVSFFKKLPRGKQTLRGRITTLGGASIGKQREVTVRPDRNRTTSARDDGAYSAKKGSARVTVADDGRTLKAFNTPVTAYCFGATVEDNRFQILFAGIDSAPIAPDGSVTAILRTKSKRSEVQLTGRVRNRRFKGEASIYIQASRCNGTREVALRLR